MVVVSLFLLFLGALLLYCLAYRPLGKLAGFDVLALPGAAIELAAKLEQDGPGFINPDVKGVEIEFYSLGPRHGLPALHDSEKKQPVKLPEGTKVGSALTGKNGIAALSLKAPQEPGNHFYRAGLKDPKRLPLKDPEVYLIVSVAPAEQQLLITDIDNTICQTKLSATWKDEPEKAPPLEGAAAVLSAASKDHRLIYLTARPTSLCHRTRHWLGAHGFPPGPVFFRDLWSEVKKFNSESDYKADFIQTRIKAVWKNIPWGVGNTEGDAKAYQANAIAAILVGQDSKEQKAGEKNVYPVPDWKTVEQLIKK